MKMPDREREGHCQRHTGGGKGDKGETERDGRPMAVTKAEFNHPKHAARWSAVEAG